MFTEWVLIDCHFDFHFIFKIHLNLHDLSNFIDCFTLSSAVRKCISLARNPFSV